MNVAPSRAIIAIALILMWACNPGAPRTPATKDVAAPPEAAFARWVAAHAVPITSVESMERLDDLDALRPIIGDARVIALGESGHGIHEFLAFRNRLVASLARDAALTAVAAETGVFEGTLVDDYINGGSIDPATAAQAAFQWDGSLRALDDNRGLLEFLRRRNAAAKGQKIHFYGIDLSGGDGRQGQILRARRSVDAALTYADRCAGDATLSLRQRLAALAERFTDTAYTRLSAADRNALTVGLTDLTNLLIRRRDDCVAVTSSSEFDRALANAVSAQQVDAMFRVTPDANSQHPDFRDMAMARDAAMAANLRAALEREGPKGRILLYAHNVHVQKVAMRKEAYASAFPGKPVTKMGQYLRSTLGDRMVIIGTAFSISGAPDLRLLPSQAGSVDGDLAAVGLPLFAIDLRKGSGDPGISPWLQHPRLKRQLNDPDDDRYAELVPGDAFDAIVFIRAVSLAKGSTPPGGLH